MNTDEKPACTAEPMPKWALDAALNVMQKRGGNLQLDIARALVAERERCARVAKNQIEGIDQALKDRPDIPPQTAGQIRAAVETIISWVIEEINEGAE